MKLQQKTALVFISLLILLLIVVSVFSSLVVLSSYADLEQQYAAKDLRQTLARIDDESLTLSAIVSDWGPWDDSWDFVQGNKPGFIAANLAPETFGNLRINAMVYTNRSGGIVYAAGYDGATGTMTAVPDDLIRQLDRSNPLMDMSDPRKAERGIIVLDKYPMIIASRPIVRTDFSGEPRGVVIMGRYLDEDETGRLASLTLPSLSFTRVDDPSLPPQVLAGLREAPAGGLVRPRDGRIIDAYAMVPDIYGRDALVIGISEPRSIYQQGTATTLKFIWVILASGLVFGIVAMFLLDMLVLSRLNELDRQVHAIGTDPDRRLSIGGDDEFSRFAGQINRMLDMLNRARDRLSTSEARFRDLAELLPQIIFEMDTEGRILYINRAGAEQFGISAETIGKGINIRNYVIPENHPLMERGLAAVMAGRRSPGDLYILKRPDGTLIKALATTSLITKDGKATGFRGIVVDITERIRLSEQLEESTNLLKGILQASPVGVFQLDAAGRVTFVNETFTTITGLGFEAIQGRYWADIVPPEDRRQLFADLESAIRERRMIRSETRYYHPCGTVYWLLGHAVPITDSKGTLTGWVGTITDITDRKKAEDALRESEEKYRALTENTADILFSTDMDGVITYVSPQVNKYGFLESEVTGKPLKSIIHPADASRVESNLSRDLKEGAQFVAEFRILDKWGAVYWIEEKSSLRLDLSGKPVGIYGILRDVTERRRVEDAIDIANKKLNLMNQITRHDILNTITGLLGCVDMAKAMSSPEEKDQLLNDIRDLTRVIQRHITFTREYQEVGVHLPQWQNINRLIRNVVQNFEHSGITFNTRFDETEVYADPLLEKVFYNLVDNALRYGKTLTMVSIYPEISDRGFSIVFEDDGIGVPDAQKREIFKRGVGQNTGMGLFLTAEILAITGITIEENGTYGRGARFEIRIPNGTWRFFRAKKG
jgi:PAS domain S-box-containing protein